MEDDADVQEMNISARAGKKEKEKHKAQVQTPTHGHSNSNADEHQKDVNAKKEKRQSLTAVGPEGRDRKRSIKLAEGARRRARDAKFDVEGGNYKSLVSRCFQQTADNRAGSSRS